MITSIYKLPFKKNIEPKRKTDTLVAYEMADNRKTPLNLIFMTKEKIPSNLSEDEIDEFERKSSLIKTETEKSKFQPLPIIKQNELNAVNFFVSGLSGSGKSFYVSQLVNNIKSLDRFKDADVFLITGQTKPDPAYEDNIEKYLKVNLDSDDFFTLTYSDFEDSIVIFDDVNSLGNRAQEAFIFNLQKSLSENARKNNVALININHSSRDFLRTKYIVHEANYFTLFPSYNWNDSRKFLKSYLDYDEAELKEIKKLSRHTRAMTFHKQTPQYIICDHVIKLV